MTENNKIKEQKIKELAEAFKEKNNSKNDNTLNGVILPGDEDTNITELENDIKKLEEAIFTKENLQALVDNKNTITVNGIPFQFLDTTLNDFLGNKKTIKKILHDNIFLAKNSLDIIMGTIFKNKKQSENLTVTPVTENGFAIQCIDNKHFITVKIKEGVNDKKEEQEKIFDSLEDGRQLNNCCGIHALEGVLIAEALTKNGKNIEEFKAKHNNQLVKTSEDDLIEQRKILFKMEILDALNNAENIILEEDKLQELYNLYFEEFQARCAALQAVKKELRLEPDKVKLDKVPEAQKKEEAPEVEAQKQSIPAAPQQIKQKKEVETEVQKPTTRIVVENPGDIPQKEEPKKEDEPAVENKEGENDKKFDLPSNEAVSTLPEVKEGRQECDTPSKEEPNPSKDTQNSEISTTSSILSEQHPKMRPDTVYNWVEEESTDIETYGIEDNKIKKIEDINKKAAQLYLDILMQVLNETNKENGLEEITEEKIEAIRKQTEERINACFTIRDENNNIVKILTDEEKKSLELARADYKNRAKVDERVVDIFNKLDELKNCHGAAREIQRQLFQREEAAASVKI